MKSNVLLLTFSLIFFSCSSSWDKSKDAQLLAEAKDNFRPLPNSLIDKEKYKNLIHLGQKLYFEKKLSANGTISCNSCHNLETFGVDNLPTSPGHDGTFGGRNSPTTLNAAIHIAQFWDGRAKDVEEQALGPLLNPIEHGLKNKKQAMEILKEAGYRPLFKKAFPNVKNYFIFKNIGVAIGAFEKTLITPSKFDDFLNGNLTALNNDEKNGLDTFIQIGCTSCHEGQGIGGGMYQKLGLVNEYPVKDKGRYEVTKDEDDLYVFKVPSLRNIVHTGPYLHDGQIKSLDKMIKIMGKHQLDEELSNKQVYFIKAFLGSLSSKK